MGDGDRCSEHVPHGVERHLKPSHEQAAHGQGGQDRAVEDEAPAANIDPVVQRVRVGRVLDEVDHPRPDDRSNRGPEDEVGGSLRFDTQ